MSLFEELRQLAYYAWKLALEGEGREMPKLDPAFVWLVKELTKTTPTSVLAKQLCVSHEMVCLAVVTP